MTLRFTGLLTTYPSVQAQPRWCKGKRDRRGQGEEPQGQDREWEEGGETMSLGKKIRRQEGEGARWISESASQARVKEKMREMD